MNEVKKNIANRFLKIFKNRNILIFLTFVVISSFLWFLNAINKEYTTDVKLIFNLKNLPVSMSLNKKNDNKLKITVFGDGYNLLKEKIEEVNIPLIIDIRNKENKIIIRNKKDNPTEAYILTEELTDLIQKRFGKNINIVKIKPDTIFLDIIQNHSKKLPVIPKVDYEPETNYMLNGDIKVIPDSIIVYGTAKQIDTMKQIYTTYTKLGKIGDNHIKELKIAPIKSLRYSRNKVLIDIPTEKYTETQIEKEIKSINTPNNLIMKSIPHRATIFYKVPISLFDQITKKDFNLTIDYENIQEDEVIVNAKTFNKYIKITKIDPLSVKYIIEEKDTIND